MSDSTTVYDALICGAGIAGLAAARAFTRNGLRVMALERRDTSTDAGLTIILPGNAIAALSALGLGEQIRTIGRPIATRQYRTSADQLLFEIDEATFWGDENQPRCVWRSDLQRILEDGLPEGAVKRGCNVSLLRNEGDRVGVGVADAHAPSFHGRFLVGADGVNSLVRRTFIDGAQVGTAYLAPASWRFIAPNPGVTNWTLWIGRTAMVLLVPTDGDEVYGWVAGSKKPLPKRPETVFSFVSEFPRHVRMAVLNAFTTVGKSFYSPLEEVRPVACGRERTLLIGDASHAMAPVWAQGAALAIEDAVVLADLIRDSPQSSSIARDFEDRRRGRVGHVRDMTDRMSRAARLPPFLRRVMLPYAGPRSYRDTYLPLKEPFR